MNKKLLLFLLLAVFTIIIRVYKLNEIPGEWFGDISNVHEYVQQILRGEWPFYFFQSPGPLYHYLITPFVLLFYRQGYLTYKISSSIISFFGLIAAFFFFREVTSKKIALIGVLIMSFSLWFLIWSRLGNSQIAIPLLISLMSYFLIVYMKKKKKRDLLLGVTVSSLGWYTYPQTFIFPVIFWILLSFDIFLKRQWKMYAKDLLLALIISVILILPFISIVNRQRVEFTQGYIGEKVFSKKNHSIRTVVQATANNLFKTILMMHQKGDPSFRVNIPNKPQLDIVSGILFLGGFIYLIRKKSWGLFLFIIFMIPVLALPSASPAILPGEIPNNGRSIAMLPFIFLLVALGLMEIYHDLGFLVGKRNGQVIVTFLIIIMTYFNLHSYFFPYAFGLPNGNTAPGVRIAKVIDEYSKDYSIYFASCCWGEWGEPEPKAIMYVLEKEKYQIIHNKILESCQEIRHPALIVFSYKDVSKVNQYRQCFTGSEVKEIVSSKSDLVAVLIIGK